MKNVLNQRPTLIVAISLALGILLAEYSLWLLFIPCLILAILYAVFRKKPVLFSVIFLSLALGFTSYSVQKAFFLNRNLPSGEYEVEATVQEIGTYSVTLSFVKVDGEWIDGNLSLKTNASLTIGDRVAFQSFVEGSDRENRYFFADRILYETKAEEISVVGVTANPFLLVNRAMYETLFRELDSTAPIAYAILTGTTSFIDVDSLNGIRYGGIAHIFAVSGLHIGMLFSAVLFLGGLLPIRRNWKYLLAFSFVFFYAGVCAFTASSLRALIVCGVYSVNRCLGRKGDFLKNIGFAAALILLFRPVELFLVGFQLSITACIGIALFLKFFRPVLPGDGFARQVGSTFAAEIATFPILLDSFGYVSGVGLLLNVVLIPFIAPLMVFLFVGLLLSPISPVFFLPAKGLLTAFLWLLQITDFEPFLIRGFSFGWVAICYYLSILLFSDLYRAKRWVRILLASIMMGVTIVLLILGFGN